MVTASKEKTRKGQLLPLSPAGGHLPQCPVPMLSLDRNYQRDGFIVGCWALAKAGQESRKIIVQNGGESVEH